MPTSVQYSEKLGKPDRYKNTSNKAKQALCTNARNLFWDFFVVVPSKTESRGVYLDKYIAKQIEDNFVSLS